MVASNYTRGRATPLITIQAVGFDKIINDIAELERNWARESRDVLGEGAKLFKEAAQKRSPYLYGVLRGAHFDEVTKELEDPVGIVSILHTRHHVLGGYADDYGPRIHREGRPWFGWTIEQEGSRILGKIGASYARVYEENLPGSSG